ncbi:hypothetical protein C8R47DRAFT_735506 [Mycena vitilis]|nr:hypothetical protein C8R47DRAFT_735506 [Mycena vitilis]
MSTTTQILFNSPALHSLKRDQLVKLCKIHSIKANGKNVDLVERLKTHAQSLPRDSPLSVAFRSEQEGGPPAQDGEEEEEEVQAPQEEKFNPRPSSQWELVMDSITEEAEDSSSQGTLSSLKSGATLTGEFGTGSSKSTTVGSSIRALASSFGLKRQATGSSTSTRALDTVSSKSSSKLLSSFPLPPPADELSKHSIPYDALPPPSLTDLQTDHFTFDTTDPTVVAANLNPTLGTAPLPGHTLRPGVPAPVNARLSLGLAPRTPSKQGPTTTIRLVSFGSLASAVPTATLPPAGDTPNLKPFETTFDLDLGSPLATPAFPKLYPALPASPPMDDTERRMSLEASMSVDHDEEEDEDVPMPGAFAFGEPSTPKTPMKPFVFGSPSPQPAPFNFSVKSPDPTTKAKLAAEVIEEMNRRVFGGAAPMTPPPVPRVIRPLGSAKKSTGEGKSGGGRFDKAHEQAFGKMESIADVAAKRQGLKRKSSAASVRVGFTAAEDQGRGKRVRVDEANGNAEPVSSVKPESAEPEEERTKEKSQKEKDAIRRKLEASRARRRSSAAAGGARRMSGRVSGAGVLSKSFPLPRDCD